MNTDEIAELIERELSGTAGVMVSPSSLAEDNGLTEDQILEVCGEIGVENCSECGWWTFRDEAQEVDGEMYCMECKP